MIKFHPTDTQLVKFSEGGLASAESILTAAHCDMCSDCSTKVSLFTESLAHNIFGREPHREQPIQRDFIFMFENIVHQTCESLDLQPLESGAACTIELDGRKLNLPPTLTRFADRLGEWSHLVGKIWQAQIDIGGGYLGHLIYMEKGGTVPEHTHKGSEITLVLDGEFSDGLDVYRNGDFISLNDTHIHAPVSQVQNGCLVLSIIDQPLYFTSGWAKLINPLSSLYYKVKARK